MPADIRDIRTFATEAKFIVHADVAAAIAEWARGRLEADPHGGGAFGDEYSTATLYFDTTQLHVFHRRGSFGRSRYRVRRYGDAALVFLERKLRERTILAKRRTPVPIDALTSLDGEWLPQDWAGRWFHARLAARRLRPACQVSYRRMARVAGRGEDAVRLTLDASLSAQPVCETRFQPSGGQPLLDGRCILELKYRHRPPVLFKSLVETFALTPQPASRYRLGMAATGQAAPSPAVAPMHAAEAGPAACRTS